MCLGPLMFKYAHTPSAPSALEPHCFFDKLNIAVVMLQPSSSASETPLIITVLGAGLDITNARSGHRPRWMAWPCVFWRRATGSGEGCDRGVTVTNVPLPARHAGVNVMTSALTQVRYSKRHKIHIKYSALMKPRTYAIWSTSLVHSAVT